MNDLAGTSHPDGGGLRCNPPRVSVLLSCYNADEFLAEAVESILAQTFDDFELIIIDDGSHDRTAAIIKHFTDSRIRFYQQKNQGLAASLNRAIGLARGEYIARMDADDISLPERLGKQVAFLDSHPECGLVGCWASIWEGERDSGRAHTHPSDSAQLKFELLFDNPFVHSSMMIRKDVFARVGNYATDSDQQPQDYQLWSRVMRHFDVANIPEILQVYREVPKSISRTRKERLVDLVMSISRENLAWVSGRSISDPTVRGTAALMQWQCPDQSSTPSLRQIAGLLYGAAEKLGGPSDESRKALRKKAGARVESILDHYCHCRYGGILGRIIYKFNLTFPSILIG